MRNAAGAEWIESRGDTRAPTDVVDVEVMWVGAASPTVLELRQIGPGGSLSVGEEGDVIVPWAALRAARATVLRYDGEPVVHALPGARLAVAGQDVDATSWPLARGVAVELSSGPIALRFLRGEKGARPAGAPFNSLRDSGASYVVGSALVHAAVFATIALFTPALAAEEEDALDPDRVAFLSHMLNAAAAREEEQSPVGGPATKDAAPTADGTAGGRTGATGAPHSTSVEGRAASRGSALPAEARGARQRELAEAAAWGMPGLLAALRVGQDDGAVHAWGRPDEGSDAVDAAGRLFGASLGDVLGTGGLTLDGPGQGGGGPANVVGLGGLVGDALGRCDDGRSPCVAGAGGIGAGRDQLPSGHRTRSPRIRCDADRDCAPQVNGRLPPEVIQRVVRQNDGRYRACYEQGLRTNPGLTGRVTVKFVVDRSGAVAIASDGGSDLPDEGVRRCVVSAFSALSFPAPESGMLTVSYPFFFSPE